MKPERDEEAEEDKMIEGIAEDIEDDDEMMKTMILF